MKPEFSIIIPTRNSIGIIESLIESLVNQDFSRPYEVVFLVTRSHDGTEDYLNTCPIENKRVISIEPADFSHGRTRMKGAEAARGDFIIFFTEDIVPIGRSFLTELTNPVINAKAAAAYGVFQTDPEKQDPVQAYLNNDWHESYPEITLPISAAEWKSMSGIERRLACNFDNCASCIRKDILLELRFPDVPYGEDMFFAKRVLLNNHRIVLAKRARFYHWHNMSFGYFLKRMCLDQHLSRKEFGIIYVRNKPMMIGSITIRVIHRAMVILFRLRLPVKKKWHWIKYHARILTADFLGKYIGGLTESASSKRFHFINRRLYVIQKQILDEISRRSIPRY